MSEEETCVICGEPEGEENRDKIIKHHVTYFPEKTVPVHRKCHNQAHGDPQYAPPEGDSKRFYGNQSRITISLDEDTRARLDAHPEITASGLFRKAVLELDQGKSPEQVAAWQALEVEKLKIEAKKAEMQHALALENLKVQRDQQMFQMEMLSREGSIKREREELDKQCPATRTDILAAQLSLDRLKEVFKIVEKEVDATYIVASMGSIGDLLVEESHTIHEINQINAEIEKLGRYLDNVREALNQRVVKAEHRPTEEE